MTNAPNTVALITGANKGIGFQVARDLGKQGITVYVGARDRSRGEQAAKRLQDEGIDARFIEFNLANEATIAAAVETIDKKQGWLDILVNNAGTIFEGDGTPGEADLGAVKKTFDTNFLNH